jgi:hypothetical protein
VSCGSWCSVGGGCDLPHTATKYLTKPDPRQITADQTESLPDQLFSAADE